MHYGILRDIMAMIKKNIIFIVTVALLSTLAIYEYLFLLRPKRVASRELAEALSAAKREAETITQSLKNMDAIQKEVGEMEALMKRLEEGIAENRDSAQWVSDISHALGAHGLSVVTMSPRKQTNTIADKYEAMNIDLTVRGLYKDLGEFIEEIRQTRPFIIEGLKIRSLNEKQASIEASMDVLIYQKL